MSNEAELTRLRSLVERLVKARCGGRLRRLPEVWDSEPATQIRHGAQATIRVLAESLEHGGYSAAKVVERLREEGVPVTISCLHGEGLQAVTNALVREVMDPPAVHDDDGKPPRVLKVGDRLKRTGSVEPVTQILSPYEVMTTEGYPPIRSYGYPWWELWEHEDGTPILPLDMGVRDE